MRTRARRVATAQVLEHFGLVERRSTQLVKVFVARAHEAGLTSQASSTPIVDSIDLAIMRDRRRKVMARESNLPTRGLDADSA